MATRSETYYLQLYKDAFSKSENVEALVSLFISSSTIFSPSLLTKLGAVTQAEWKVIDKDSLKDGYAKRKEKQAKLLIDKVSSKNTLESYRGFRGFAKREAERSHQIEILYNVFPFSVDEDNAGLVPRIVPTAAPSSVAPSRSEKPTILWVTSTQSEFYIVKHSLLKKYNLNVNQTSTKYDFHCEEITISVEDALDDSSCRATLFIAFPKTELTGPSPYRQLLMNFDPRPNLAVMTGPCLPLPQSSQVDQSDVVVVTCTNPLPIEGEVQYLTELWNLDEGQLNGMFSGHKPRIFFGRATNTMGHAQGGDNDYLVHCPRAVQFYAAAKQLEGIDFLAVTQVEGHTTASNVDVAPPRDDTDKSTALYVYNIILNIIEVL